jgi:hypothetical protein
LRFRILLFECADLLKLFDVFFEHRKDICISYSITHTLPFSAAYRIIESKMNQAQWNSKYGYYMVGPEGESSVFEDWQAGWCGGGMNSLALLYNGSQLSRERADSTMNAIFSLLQNDNGFIIPIFSQGRRLGDGSDLIKKNNVLLIRRNADLLVFTSRHILLKYQRREEVPESWLEGLRSLTDIFVRLWNRYGQFGQFIDMETEEILQGSTASAAIASGGLALAFKVLGDNIYLDVAKESARYYYDAFVKNGLLNGGAGEILQNCDSESAVGMMESFVILYETTKDRQWLLMAEGAAKICASWQVSYDFIFPAKSTFGRMGMRTSGSIYANVQNKHSSPGFCTLSGASLLELYRATGDQRYLSMCRETAHNITQYLSRLDCPILTWDEKFLPAGWMNERVNMSDWEGMDRIGGVFYGGCWCETACMLTYAEIPGILFLSDCGEVIVIDHIDVTVSDATDCWKLSICNSTDFDADVKILIDSRDQFHVPLSQCISDLCKIVTVPKHGNMNLFVSKKVEFV